MDGGKLFWSLIEAYRNVEYCGFPLTVLMYKLVVSSCHCSIMHTRNHRVVLTHAANELCHLPPVLVGVLCLVGIVILTLVCTGCTLFSWYWYVCSIHVRKKDENKASICKTRAIYKVRGDAYLWCISEQYFDKSMCSFLECCEPLAQRFPWFLINFNVPLRTSKGGRRGRC